MPPTSSYSGAISIAINVQPSESRQLPNGRAAVFNGLYRTRGVAPSRSTLLNILAAVAILIPSAD
jgi:hypothetical protein